MSKWAEKHVKSIYDQTEAALHQGNAHNPSQRRFPGRVEVCTLRRRAYAVGVPNEPQTPSGTPNFLACTDDWAFRIACQQRKVAAKAMQYGQLPSANELAHVIRVALVPKRVVIRELVDAARAMADATPEGSPERGRLLAALEAAKQVVK